MSARAVRPEQGRGDLAPVFLGPVFSGGAVLRGPVFFFGLPSGSEPGGGRKSAGSWGPRFSLLITIVTVCLCLATVAQPFILMTMPSSVCHSSISPFGKVSLSFRVFSPATVSAPTVAIRRSRRRTRGGR